MVKMKRKKRILFVGMTNSVHTAKWINNLKDTEYEIFLFPSIDIGIVNSDFKNITVFQTFYKPVKNSEIKVIGIPLYIKQVFISGIIFVLKKIVKNYLKYYLKIVLFIIKPDIIHSLEIQSAGYLVLETRKSLCENPKWIVSNWGSDIYLFGKLKAHQDKIISVLKFCDAYACECERDITLAKEFGFEKKIFYSKINTAGFHYPKEIDTLLTSERKSIMIKGYQGWSGRALVVLKAILELRNYLKEYSIYVYSASAPEVFLYVDLLRDYYGLKIEIVPLGTNNKTILSLHGQSRISIGASISDGISTSLLEAMYMGSFPIQSCTSCANEWIEIGTSGFIIDPENSTDIKDKMLIALQDDNLINKASLINEKILKEKLEYNLVRNEIITAYENVLK